MADRCRKSDSVKELLQRKATDSIAQLTRRRVVFHNISAPSATIGSVAQGTQRTGGDLGLLRATAALSHVSTNCLMEAAGLDTRITHVDTRRSMFGHHRKGDAYRGRALLIRYSFDAVRTMRLPLATAGVARSTSLVASARPTLDAWQLARRPSPPREPRQGCRAWPDSLRDTQTRRDCPASASGGPRPSMSSSTWSDR
jgi:hypothetical protein